MHWALYTRLLRPQALQRWIRFQVAFQALGLVAVVGYLLLMLRHRPPGIAWGAPGAAVVIANAVALQFVLFRLMRTLRQG